MWGIILDGLLKKVICVWMFSLSEAVCLSRSVCTVLETISPRRSRQVWSFSQPLNTVSNKHFWPRCKLSNQFEDSDWLHYIALRSSKCKREYCSLQQLNEIQYKSCIIFYPSNTHFWISLRCGIELQCIDFQLFWIFWHHIILHVFIYLFR